MKQKLITLPSGDAISPEFVIAVRRGEYSPPDSYSGEIKNRVIVDYGTNKDDHFHTGYVNCLIEYFETEEAAKTFQAGLIQQVNASK